MYDNVAMTDTMKEDWILWWILWYFPGGICDTVLFSEGGLDFPLDFVIVFWVEFCDIVF